MNERCTDFEFKMTGVFTKEFSRLNCKAGTSSQANKEAEGSTERFQIARCS